LKKVIIVLLLIGIFLISAGYIVGNMVINKMTSKALSLITEHGKDFGIELIQARFQKGKIASLNSVIWQGIYGTVKHADKSALDKSNLVSIAVNTVKISLISSGFASLEAWNFDIMPVPDSGNNRPLSAYAVSSGPQTEKIHGDYFFTIFPFDSFHPLIGVKSVISEIKKFAGTGRTNVPVDFFGTIAFSMMGNDFLANLRIENRGKENVLVMNRGDVKKMASYFDDKVITDADIDVIAQNPLIAVKLLHIKNKARTTAMKSHENDPSIPEDAYRHVLWSYLLTKEFGEEFAKAVTDAHEEGLTGNTEAESQMDYKNNEVGREYALKGINESVIIDLVRNDLLVIRQPE